MAGGVYKILPQPDGKILVVGVLSGIVRLNADGSFDPGSGPSAGGIISSAGFINAIALQSDGKIIVGGNFTTFNAVARNGLARLNSDGSLDMDFNPSTNVNNEENAGILAIVLQSDGKIIVSGSGIARFNNNGSIDKSFNPDVDVSALVGTVALQPDGKIIVASIVSTFDEVMPASIARLNADGSLDTDFNPNPDALGHVNAVALQPDGKIIVAGNVAYPDAGERSSIVRLNADGSLDGDFDPKAGANGPVSFEHVPIGAVILEPDGEIIIGGNFTNVNGVARNGIALLKANGKLDAIFDPDPGANDTVLAIALTTAGKIIVDGLFSMFADTSRNSIALLNTDASLDDSFQADNVSGPNNFVTNLVLQPDGKVIANGVFTTVDGVSRNGIVRLNSDGSLDTGFDPGAGATLNLTSPYQYPTLTNVVLQPDGRIIVIGEFNQIDGVNSNGIARLNANGSLDKSFNPSLAASAFVATIALQPDGKIIVAGADLTFDGKTSTSVVRLNADGGLDTSFISTAVANGEIDSVALQADDKIVVSFSIDNSEGSSTSSILRLNADGSLDPSFTPTINADGYIESVALQTDGKIILGGFFTLYGTRSSDVVRLNADGGLDANFACSSGMGSDDSTRTVALQSDGKIIVTGSFDTYNSVARNGVVRLNPDGSLDTDFDPGSNVNGAINAVALQPDGKCILGGNFVQVGSIVRNYIARVNVDGSVDPDFVPGTGVPLIDALALQSDDDMVVIGGIFSDVNGTPINALARLNTDGSLDATFAPGFTSGDTVQAVALQPDDGEVLAAALVTDDAATMAAVASGTLPHRPHAQSKIKNPITRHHKLNGQVDPTFNALTDGVTLALLGLHGGRAVIGGSFANVDGSPHPNLARLNADGTLDTGFVGVADGTVRALSLQSGSSNTVIAGGDFASVDGAARSHVARLNADGSLDASFDPGTGPNGTVNTVRAMASGQVLIGGSFTSVDGVARGGLARLNADGSLDPSYAPAPATVGLQRATRPTRQDAPAARDTSAVMAAVMSLDVQDDGKVIVGGLFDQLGDATRNNVARLNTDGSVDTK